MKGLDMEWNIQVVSTPSLRDKYKRLLTSDWKKSTLDAVLELLWKEIETSARQTKIPLLEVLDPGRTSISGSGINADVIEEIRHFRRHFRGSDLIPAVPEDFSVRKGRLRAQAETTWTYLIIENLAHLRGETGFIADTQSLLFLLAIDFLLPGLEDAGDVSAKDCLINALYMHTFISWTQDPQRQAHYFFLQAALMDYLGKPQLCQENLLISLNLTHLEDHSFLTKVQGYIFSLLDAGEMEEAKRFLMKVYRYAHESYLAELQEMIDNVQEHAEASRQ
jgi:hypothetical protein